MSTRLAPVNWQEIVASGEADWEDPNFTAVKASIVDPMMRRETRISNW